MLRARPRRLLRDGFTIVELLIVIVVIGILAAITIVAYNGVQQRARNTQTIAAVNSYIKVYTTYAIDNGAYPIAGSNYCVGQGYVDGLCWDHRGYTTPSGLAIALRPYIGSTLPNPSVKPVYRNSVDDSRAGILYVSDNTFRYQLEGDATDCGIAGAVGAVTAGQSAGPECTVYLQDPVNL